MAARKKAAVAPAKEARVFSPQPKKHRGIPGSVESGGDTLFGREQAANLIGVDAKTLWRWEERGIVEPTIGANGQRLFGLKQIDALRAKRRAMPSDPDLQPIETAIAVKVFKAFSDGVAPEVAVHQLEVHPDDVQRLREQWDQMRARDRLLDEYRAKAAHLESVIESYGPMISSVAAQNAALSQQCSQRFAATDERLAAIEEKPAAAPRVGACPAMPPARAKADVTHDQHQQQPTLLDDIDNLQKLLEDSEGSPTDA